MAQVPEFIMIGAVYSYCKSSEPFLMLYSVDINPIGYKATHYHAVLKGIQLLLNYKGTECERWPMSHQRYQSQWEQETHGVPPRRPAAAKAVNSVCYTVFLFPLNALTYVLLFQME